jgi:hypothetical protein
MTEQELRALVREAVERHLRRPEEKRGRLPFSAEPAERGTPPAPVHPSHLMLTVAPGSEAQDGMCVIEPAVRCNHCGFCQSLGH